MFSFVFFDVHVIKMGCIIDSDLYHGGGWVQRWQAVTQAGPHSSHHHVGDQIPHCFSPWLAQNKVGPTQNLLHLVERWWNDIVTVKTNEKLMKLFPRTGLVKVEISSSVVSVWDTKLVFQQSFSLGKLKKSAISWYITCYLINYITCNKQTKQHTFSLWLSLIVPSALRCSARACTTYFLTDSVRLSG